MKVIQCGPCLNTNSHKLLLAPMSQDDIRKALFNIDNDKAPGLDGHSSFFKKTWDIIGEDFCNAIQDFFSSGELLKQVNHSIIAFVPSQLMSP